MKRASEVIALLPQATSYTPDLSDYGEAQHWIEQACALGLLGIDLSTMAFMVDTNYTKEARNAALVGMFKAGIPVTTGGKWQPSNNGGGNVASISLETHPLWLNWYAADEASLGLAIEAAALAGLRALTLNIDRATGLSNFKPGSTIPSGIKQAWKRDGLAAWFTLAERALTPLGYKLNGRVLSW